MKHYDYDTELSNSNRLNTAKRGGKLSYGLNPPHEQLINQLAKVRLLEDELFAERARSTSLQRKNYEYIDTIAQLEYMVGELRLELAGAHEQIVGHDEAERQIHDYAVNLREVGQELISLNEVLEKKNRECKQLYVQNSRLKAENLQLRETIDSADTDKSSEMAKMKEILESVCHDLDPQFNIEAGRYLQLIEEGINDLKGNLSHTKNALEKIRKQHSEAIIKQKQGYIALEYELKLAVKRNEDLEKKKNIESACVVDKRVEDIIDQMLKKQEDLSAQIADLHEQNDNLRGQIEAEKMASSRYKSIREDDFEKQLKMAKDTIRALIAERQELQEKYDELSAWRDIENSKSMSEELDMGRRLRELSEENKRLKIRISELESDKKMLQKELAIRSSN